MIPIKSTDEPSWLVRARREIGVHEIVGTRHNPRVLEYHQATRLKAVTDETAWCAAFVCWCLEQEGVTSTKSAAAASYANFGRSSELVPGAIVVFGKHDPDAKGTGHVAFLDYIGPNETLFVVGGNQGNRVCSAPRARDGIVAVRWPIF